MADGGGPTEQDRSAGMRATARHRTKGARALGYLGLFQVTRRKGGTLSRRDRSNGYALKIQKTHTTDQLFTKLANYYVDIHCLSSNISTYIHCLGS